MSDDASGTAELDRSLGEADDGLLAPEPSVLTGSLIGYGRISTAGQNLDRQIRALRAVGCTRIFTDTQSGKTADRSHLDACRDYLRPGDTLVVPSLDRLSRSLADLITLVAELRRAEVGFRSLHEALDTTTPGGRLVFHVFAALAEFIRELIVQGTNEGLAAARSRGQRLGRPPALNPEQLAQARHLLTRPDNTVASIARLLGVSRSTLYKHVPEITGRPTATEADGRPRRPLPPPTTSTSKGLGQADSRPSGHIARAPAPSVSSCAKATGTPRRPDPALLGPRLPYEP